MNEAAAVTGWFVQSMSSSDGVLQLPAQVTEAEASRESCQLHGL